MLVATYRSDELHRRHPLRPFLNDHAGGVERIELVRFDEDELVRLLTAIRGDAPDPELAARLLARSEGNAFLAEELLAAGGAELPETLRDAMMVRVERRVGRRQGGAARRRLRRSASAPPPAGSDGAAVRARAGGRLARGGHPPRPGAQRRRCLRVPARAGARGPVRGRPAGRARPPACRDRPCAGRRAGPGERGRRGRGRGARPPLEGRPRARRSPRGVGRRRPRRGTDRRVPGGPAALRLRARRLGPRRGRRGPRRDGSDRPDAPRRRRGAPRRRPRAGDRAGA